MGLCLWGGGGQSFTNLYVGITLCIWCVCVGGGGQSFTNLYVGLTLLLVTSVTITATTFSNILLKDQQTRFTYYHNVTSNDLQVKTAAVNEF